MGMGNKEIAPAAGYTGTPFAKKPGIKQGSRIKLINAPDYYLSVFTDLPGGLIVDKEGDNQKTDLIHFFTKNAEEYTSMLPLLKQQIKANGIIGVSWPKKSSKIETDITENLITNRPYVNHISF